MYEYIQSKAVKNILTELFSDEYQNCFDYFDNKRFKFYCMSSF